MLAYPSFPFSMKSPVRYIVQKKWTYPITMLNPEVIHRFQLIKHRCTLPRQHTRINGFRCWNDCHEIFMPGHISGEKASQPGASQTPIRTVSLFSRHAHRLSSAPSIPGVRAVPPTTRIHDSIFFSRSGPPVPAPVVLAWML